MGALTNSPQPSFPTAEMKAALDGLKKASEEWKARGYVWGAYGEAFALLKAMEDRLAKNRFRRIRFLYDPATLWFRGLQQMIASYGRVYMVALPLGVAGLWITGQVPPEFRHALEITTVTLNAYLTLTLVFAAPSAYCSAGTNQKHVEFVHRWLREWKIDSPVKADFLGKNIKIFEQRAARRLTIFRWMLGAGWALYVSPLIGDAIKRWNGTAFSLPDLVVLFPPIGVLVAAYFVIEAYARGVDLLFRALELGVNEQIVDLDRIARSNLPDAK